MICRRYLLRRCRWAEGEAHHWPCARSPSHSQIKVRPDSASYRQLGHRQHSFYPRNNPRHACSHDLCEEQLLLSQSRAQLHSTTIWISNIDLHFCPDSWPTICALQRRTIIPAMNMDSAQKINPAPIYHHDGNMNTQVYIAMLHLYPQRVRVCWYAYGLCVSVDCRLHGLAICEVGHA